MDYTVEKVVGEDGPWVIQDDTKTVIVKNLPSQSLALEQMAKMIREQERAIEQEAKAAKARARSEKMQQEATAILAQVVVILQKDHHVVVTQHEHFGSTHSTLKVDNINANWSIEEGRSGTSTSWHRSGTGKLEITIGGDYNAGLKKRTYKNLDPAKIARSIHEFVEAVKIHNQRTKESSEARRKIENRASSLNDYLKELEVGRCSFSVEYGSVVFKTNGLDEETGRQIVDALANAHVFTPNQ